MPWKAAEGLDGERGRNRTFNLLIKSQLLCQLSYAPYGELGDFSGASSELQGLLAENVLK